MKLNEIKSPEDLKKIQQKELPNLAEEIREFLVTSLAETGGHLSSNLGVVELTIALHYVYNSPNDKLVFDVGHQAYVHKILTNRQEAFSTLRQYQGLSGFIKRSESPHDIWEAGHAGTSISAATGLAIYEEKNNQNDVIAIIGDGSLTNGMAFEALNHIIHLGLNITIIINDNEESISPNIGAINQILASLDSSYQYSQFKEKIKKVTPKPFHKLIHNSKEKVKEKAGGSRTFFQTLGYHYYGAIDGHNLEQLINVFKIAQKEKGPKVIHVKTQKGKGFIHAEKAVVGRWHGVNPFDPKTGELKKVSTDQTYSAYFANAILENMRQNEKIITITPAMLGGSELGKIQQEFPKRIYDVGIAEEHAVTMAAGASVGGLIPIVPIYSTFLQRGYDQLLHDVARQNLHVIFGIDRSGITGPDGDTHQGLFDISFTRHIPNIVLTMGRNGHETEALLNLAIKTPKPFIIRYPKSAVKIGKDTNVKFATWEKMTTGNKGTIISYGPNVEKIAEIVNENGIDVNVINARFLKPIDENMFLNILQNDQPIIVVQEEIIAGGFGSYLLEIASKYQIKNQIEIIGVNDQFVDHGSIDDLKKMLLLNSESLKLIFLKKFK